MIMSDVTRVEIIDDNGRIDPTIWKLVMKEAWKAKIGSD